jgi:hypothetical protein
MPFIQPIPHDPQGALAKTPPRPAVWTINASGQLSLDQPGVFGYECAVTSNYVNRCERI